MPSFAKAERQANVMIARLRKAGAIRSMGTFMNFEQISQWLMSEHEAGVICNH